MKVVAMVVAVAGLLASIALLVLLFITLGDRDHMDALTQKVFPVVAGGIASFVWLGFRKRRTAMKSPTEIE